MKKALTPILIIIALVLLALAIYYWVTPAGSLPHSFPGYVAGSKHVHLKHGLAAFILAVAAGILAWFVSGNKATSEKDK
jgi:flagellar basal body-associated protein FliL